MAPSRDNGEIIHRTIETRYVVYESGFGELDGSPIWVDRISPADDQVDIITRSCNIMCNLDHPNFLRCLGSSPDDHDRTTLLIVYEGFTESLKEFMNHEPELVRKFEVPVAIGARNIEQKLTYNSISRLYRQFMRQAIDFLLYLHHEKNMSLLELDLDRNFVVKDSTLKLRCLRFNESTTTASKNEDFKHLAGVLREVFARQSLPHDFEDLLTCMDNYDHENDKVLLENHLAVLTSTRRVDMIKNFDERFKKLDRSQSNTYHSVFSTMGNEYDSTTILDVFSTMGGEYDSTTNSDVFSTMGGEYDSTTNSDVFSTMGDEYDSTTNSDVLSTMGNEYDWTKNLDGTHPEYGIIETVFKSKKFEYRIDETNAKAKIASLNAVAIQLCRNIAEHINMEKKILDKYKKNGQPFNDHTIECIIMAAFSKQLVDFQREAHKQGALKWLI